MPTVEQYAQRIVVKLKEGAVEKGKKVEIVNETQEKADAILKRVKELYPEANEKWVMNAVGLIATGLPDKRKQ